MTYTFDPESISSFYFQRLGYEYEGIGGRLIRLTVWVGLLICLYFSSFDFDSKFFLATAFSINTLFILEVFWHYGIEPKGATLALPGADQNPEGNLNIAGALSREIVQILVKAEDSQAAFERLIDRREIRFLTGKLAIKPQIAFYKDVRLEEALFKASEIARRENRPHVLPVDLFAAYLLLTEKTTKVLFDAELKEMDLLNSTDWALRRYGGSWSATPEIMIYGPGFAQSLISSWGIELKKYTADITQEALTRPSIMVGRENEVKRMEDILNKNEGANIILVGPSGVGKETVVKSLALKLYLGQSTRSLDYKRVIRLGLGFLLSGTQNEGEITQRLNTLASELMGDGNIILYIPNINDLFNFESNAILIKAFLPYLESSRVQIIGTATAGNFRKTFDKEPLFRDQFEILHIEEPNRDQAIRILQEAADQLEITKRISISYQAIQQIIELANRYYLEKVLPGKSIDLLQQAFAQAEAAHLQQIDASSITKLVTEITKIPVGLPDGKERESLLKLEETLHRRVVGQDEAINAIANAVRTSRAQLSNSSRPIAVFLFLGPTGVGKTETAKTLAEVYYGAETNMVRLDMSEFQTDDAISRLIGTATEGGLLTEPIRKNPYSLVLLDEFEKANSKILQLFLQVFDDGRLTDGDGRVVNFTNTIIIATSNAKSELIRQRINENKQIEEFKEELIDQVQSEDIFSVELINRFDGIFIFRPLTTDQVKQITGLFLSRLQKTLQDQDVQFVATEEAVAKITALGFDKVYGARPLRRFIHDHVETKIGKLIIEGNLKRGDKVTLSVDTSGELQISSVV